MLRWPPPPQEEILRDGVPFSVKEATSLVVHAPWLERVDGSLRQNPRFEDELLFNSGVQSGTSFVILDS